jgi:ABC-type branched-subunit amino acid transport system ATPase component
MSDPEQPHEPVLRLEQLSLHFGGLAALSGLDMQVGAGEIVSLIGPNGAGKTTFFNVLTGVLRADGGSFEFGGRSAGGVAPWRLVRRGIGRSFQQPRLFWALSALANSLLPEAAVSGETRRPWGSHAPALYEQALGRLGRVGLEPFRDMPAEGLSHGDQRSLELAAALAVEPRLLLLDEPTSGLSPAETAVAVELIGRVTRERGLTVLFIEHDMSVVFSVADRITVLHRGAVLAEGTPDEIRAHPEVQRAYLGTAEAV